MAHGKPLLFDDGTKGLRLNTQTLALEIATLGEDGITDADILIHDETSKTIAQLLINLPMGDFPMPLGVIYREPSTSFDDAFWAGHATQGKRTGRVADALRKGSVWKKD